MAKRVLSDEERKERKERQKEHRREQTAEENRKRDELNAYIRDEILRYNDKKAVPTFLWSRIYSLRSGKFYTPIGLRYQRLYYDFDIILLTFKFCKIELVRCLDTMNFNNEAHKVNMIMKIIESNINTVVDMVESKAKAEEKIINRDMTQFQDLVIDEDYTECNEIENDTENNTKSKWEELW